MKSGSEAFSMFLLQTFLVVAALPWLARADIRFAQLTDPHLFDSPNDEKVENEQVLQWCIFDINAREAGGERHAFIVVTGDLGLEKIEGKDVSIKSESSLREKAAELGKIISQCHVARWCFVPGNNDLVDERPDTVSNYYTFMRLLAAETPGLEVMDLAPRAADPSSGFFDIACEGGRFRFAGFDNASFKGNNSEADAQTNVSRQITNIQLVRRSVDAPGNPKGIYIFYHIPEIEDPYAASMRAGDAGLEKFETNRGAIGKKWPLNAWTVTEDVRGAWGEIAALPEVRGLFTGHFHASERSVYGTFSWMRDPGKYSVILPKLFVAPPIAIKKQEKPGYARGYRENVIDCSSGSVVSTIVWHPVNATRAWTPESTADVKEKGGENSWMLTKLVAAPVVVLVVFALLLLGWQKVGSRLAREFSVTAGGQPTMILAALTLAATAGGFGALGILAGCCAENACRAMGVGALWAMASMAVGGSLGFLFGAPRASAKPATPKEGMPATNENAGPGARTVFEDIADWLSKLIVGGTLFEANNIAKWISGVGDRFALTVNGESSGLWSGVGSAIVVYFGLVGILGVYFPTRLYLSAALRKADEGDRPMLAERADLSQSELEALELAPLNIGGEALSFGPAAQEAAAKIVKFPLEALSNWRDVRAWAKAKLTKNELEEAFKAYQKAIDIVAHDAETRLGYAVILQAKQAPIDAVLRQLEEARRSLNASDSRNLRKNIYKSLVYSYLFLKMPDSFIKALRFAREYFEDQNAGVSGGMWINIACAYGQVYRWVESGQELPAKATDLLVVKDEANEGLYAANPKQWLAQQALQAIKKAIARDPQWRDRVKSLLNPVTAKATGDDDLLVFKDDPNFQLYTGTGSTDASPSTQTNP